MSPMPARHHRSSVRALQLFGAAVFAAAVAVLVWFTWTQGSAPQETASAKYTPNRPSTIPAAKRPVAVFIGDSYTQGSGKWPDAVSKAQGWEEVNLGRGGTGFTVRHTGDAAQNGCGMDECPSFAEMVDAAAKRHPDIVVVAGGRNDGGADIADQVHDTFTGLRQRLPDAQIIAIQPMWDASHYPEFLVEYGKVIKKEVQAVDGEYLKIGSPLEGRPNLVQDDGVHPTDDGQKLLAAAVNESLTRS
jgi:lysophospholipase L1-like esterase